MMSSPTPWVSRVEPGWDLGESPIQMIQELAMLSHVEPAVELANMAG